MTIEFEAFPKIPRFSAGCIITEKIDGTNACVIITEDGQVGYQSRKRLITPDADNYGFAKFMDAHRQFLIETLGPGRHFGEWWGIGVGPRSYGLAGRRFSLFNTKRWDPVCGDWPDPVCGDWPDWLTVVPVIYQGAFSTDAVTESLAVLRHLGSLAAPGYDNPEGVVICHLPTRALYKKYLDPMADTTPKGALGIGSFEEAYTG